MLRLCHISFVIFYLFFGAWESTASSVVSTEWIPPIQEPDPGNCTYISGGFSTDGESFSAALSTGALYTWGTRNGRLIRTTALGRPYAFNVSVLAIDSLCGFILPNSSPQRFGFVSTTNGQRVREFDTDVRNIEMEYAQFQPITRHIAGTVWQHGTRLFHRTSGALVRSFEIPGRIEKLVFSQDGRVLAASNESGIIRVWDAVTGQQLFERFPFSRGERVPPVLALASDGRVLTYGSNGALIHRELSPVNAERFVTTRFPLGTYLSSFVYAPDGRNALAYNSTVKLSHPHQKQSKTLNVGTGREMELVTALIFSKTGQQLAAAVEDQELGCRMVFLRVRSQRPGVRYTSLGSLWEALGSDNLRISNEAQNLLVQSAQESIPLLRDRIVQNLTFSLPPPLQDRIDLLYRRLDNSNYRIRGPAHEDLLSMAGNGGTARWKIFVMGGQLLQAALSLEARRRIEALLSDSVFDELRSPFPEEQGMRRNLKAILVLARIGTPEARRVLAEIRRLAPGTRVGLEAGYFGD